VAKIDETRSNPPAEQRVTNEQSYRAGIHDKQCKKPANRGRPLDKRGGRHGDRPCKKGESIRVLWLRSGLQSKLGGDSRGHLAGWGCHTKRKGQQGSIGSSYGEYATTPEDERLGQKRRDNVT